jgi:hypothetical protein
MDAFLADKAPTNALPNYVWKLGATIGHADV